MRDLNTHIWEGWTIKDFIEGINIEIEHAPPFKNKKELKKFCIENQPYYKKYIPEVVEHYSYKIKKNE